MGYMIKKRLLCIGFKIIIMEMQNLRINIHKKKRYFICLRMKQYLLLLLMLMAPMTIDAQNDKKVRKSNSGSSINRSASKVSDALEQNAPDEEIADNYVTFAKELTGKKDYVRAEDYLKRALNIYLKQKKNDLSSAVYRELAKVQEMQSRPDEAIVNYKNAARFAIDNVQKQLNENDVNRLESPTDLMRQSVYIQSNIDLAKSSNSVPEQVAARLQMAELKKAQDDNPGALEELEAALKESEVSKDAEDVSFNIKQDIANTLVADKKHEEAIKLNKELVDEARQRSPKMEVKQMQSLATSYFKAGDASEGIVSLQVAYATAIEKGLTLEAKEILVQIVDYYKKESNTSQALSVYSDFISSLDTLIKNDSTLVDENFFRLQEEKIIQLEKERALKDELISRKNRNNNVLIISIILILISLVVISKILYDNIRKNKKIALQSLRREMNPHFIFNSLNSVNQFISENNELEANKYLSSYSKLMRTIMENSNKDFISLSTELEQLREYLELENQRFRDKFTYIINVDETIDSDSVMIPNMLIQPQLENAVWHGLRYKDSAGTLSLTFSIEGENIQVVIEDNGIGLKRSLELKTEHQKAHNSRGQTNTSERITLLNNLYHTKIAMLITDKTGEESGVLVTFRIPHPRRRGS